MTDERHPDERHPDGTPDEDISRTSATGDVVEEVLDEIRREDVAEALEIEDLLSGIDALDPAVPTDRLRMRLYEEVPEAFGQLEPARPAQRPQATSRHRAPWWTWAAAAAMLIAGLAVGRLWGANDARGNEVDTLRAELASMNRVVAISLLQHPSASERIRGTEFGRLASQQQAVLDALLDAINDDPNDNVRIAALDALTEHVHRDGLGGALVDSLAGQPSPMVQLAIADLLVLRGRADELRRARQTPGIDEAVRARLIGGASGSET